MILRSQPGPECRWPRESQLEGACNPLFLGNHPFYNPYLKAQFYQVKAKVGMEMGDGVAGDSGGRVAFLFFGFAILRERVYFNSAQLPAILSPMRPRPCAALRSPGLTKVL